jgi:hypothetical protein
MMSLNWQINDYYMNMTAKKEIKTGYITLSPKDSQACHLAWAQTCL